MNITASKVDTVNNFSRITQWIIAVLIVLQLITFIWGQFIPHRLNAVLFFGSSFTLGIWVLKHYYKKQVAIIEIKNNKHSLLKVFAFLGLVLAVSFFVNNTIFLKHPIIAKESDVIPTIIELCQRLLAGNFVYEPIEKFGYHLPVTYLPMQWLPYVPAEYFHFDYRWIVVAIWLLVSFIVFKDAQKYNNAQQILGYGSLFLLPYFLSSVMPDKPIGGIVFMTVEFMVAAYYVLLMKCIHFKSAIVRGLIVAICLLSRYSLVLWLPLALVVLWMNEPKKKLLITLATIIIFILCIYVIPFLSHDWMAFYKGYKYYDNAAFGEWTVSYDGSGLPHHLFRGYGFASFIYSYFPNLSIEARISLLQKLHLFGSLTSVGTLILVYLKIRNSIDYRIFLLASFKIYIALFLFLIQVPYQYLMLVDVYISIMLIWEISRYKIINNTI
ncbi:MAG TPA: hypothetical protein PKX92_02035 [Edaphocola sp.]|nr:hypothetical protein [Edaphocola sp.]